MSIVLSGSLILTGSISASGNLTTLGTITAQTLVVQTITSSIVNLTGSNIFGSRLTDTQTFTGSVVMTGSLTVNTTGTEFQVTNNGVVMGNVLTDNHSMTGSFRVTGSVTANTFSGSGANLTSIPNAALSNSTISGIALGSNLATLTIGTGLSGTSYNGSGAVTITNSGVTSIVAGTNISISGGTGAVTITNGVTNNNQLTNGAGYITSAALSSYLPLSGGTLSGVLYTTYNTATGVANNSFNTAKTILGNVHMQNGDGTSGNNRQAAITFQGGNSSEAQAGIYVSNNSSTGTAMGFATTDSYATGPQLFMTATNAGQVNFPRVRPTYAGNVILDAANFNSYSPALTGGGASGTWGINITGNAGTASAIGWASITSGTRTGHGDLRFQPPNSSFAGFQFLDTSGNGAGWFLIRGTSDTDVYTAEGITLVADKGWLTLAQRESNGKGVRIMTGVSSITRMDFTTAGAINIYGALVATGDITAFSDRRVKENITTIDSALDKVTKLRGVYYTRTDIEDKSQKIGVIAQEIQEVLPQVVSESDKGILVVSYGNITGVLIEAIKEQQTQIEELKTIINGLTK